MKIWSPPPPHRHPSCSLPLPLYLKPRCVFLCAVSCMLCVWGRENLFHLIFAAHLSASCFANICRVILAPSIFSPFLSSSLPLLPNLLSVPLWAWKCPFFASLPLTLHHFPSGNLLIPFCPSWVFDCVTFFLFLCCKSVLSLCFSPFSILTSSAVWSWTFSWTFPTYLFLLSLHSPSDSDLLWDGQMRTRAQCRLRTRYGAVVGQRHQLIHRLLVYLLPFSVGFEFASFLFCELLNLQKTSGATYYWKDGLDVFFFHSILLLFCFLFLTHIFAWN